MLPREVLYAVALRVGIALGTRTFFQPDEYFQSLEPAHHAVFGYGHLTWEWLSPSPIRSFLYPALNVPIYLFLKITRLHSLFPSLVVLCPKLLHGFLAAGTDVGLYMLTRRTLGKKHTQTSLFLSFTSFFHALSLSRSLSNSLETSLSTLAFAYYPWNGRLEQKGSRIGASLLFAALACAIRPTSALIWLFLFGRAVILSLPEAGPVGETIVTATCLGIMTVLSTVIVDLVYYGRIVFTPVSFLTTNLSGVSLFYGNNPWHYYITQALPILCTTTLPFVLHAMWFNLQSRKSPVETRTMAHAILWVITVYSCLGHKEWRFIHSILPLMHVLAAQSLLKLSVFGPEEKQRFRRILGIRAAYFYLILAQVPVAVYIVFGYCSSPISVTTYIRNIPPHEASVGILMPCHSIPGQAYIHRSDMELWALGCEPPLQYVGQNLTTYRSQTSVFFANPVKYIQQTFPPSVNPSFPISAFPATKPGTVLRTQEVYPWVHEWPRHLVFFGALLDAPNVRHMLAGLGYSEVWHAGRWWEGDGDERKGGVRVWKWMA
ncbi:glycosyltransferase family 22 protein [Cylindrobasidium torrendii FP15055 ss-10]|uniref:Mannosyltransferase n=1 Tax=Cylindrobasidium torrendii FP15055 ss-10 TaxID=1314674 RepID=A0A0D7BUF9_9AGAR|nr:glycosyltransferase family 22 protein [Cylindrobasidium torrendii FP15055 ss-10]